MEENEEEEPKPLVDYIYLPESDSSKPKLSVIDKILKKSKNPNEMPLNFGSVESEITPSLKSEILSYYKTEKNIETPNKKNIKSKEENNTLGKVKFPLTHKVTITHTSEKPITSLSIPKSCWI